MYVLVLVRALHALLCCGCGLRLMHLLRSLRMLGLQCLSRGGTYLFGGSLPVAVFSTCWTFHDSCRALLIGDRPLQNNTLLLKMLELRLQPRLPTMQSIIDFRLCFTEQLLVRAPGLAGLC